MMIVPTTTGHIVVLGLTSTIIVVNEWLNMIRVNDEMIAAWKKFQKAVNHRAAASEESVDNVVIQTRANTENINTHTEDIKRLQTTADFKELR